MAKQRRIDGLAIPHCRHTYPRLISTVGPHGYLASISCRCNSLSPCSRRRMGQRGRAAVTRLCIPADVERCVREQTVLPCRGDGVLSWRHAPPETATAKPLLPSPKAAHRRQFGNVEEIMCRRKPVDGSCLEPYTAATGSRPEGVPQYAHAHCHHHDRHSSG